MNKKMLFGLLCTVLLGGLSACSSSLKPLKNSMINVEPKPLALVGTEVPSRIHIAFPPKYFNKKARLKVVPVLRYPGGEVWGTGYTFQGEKVRDNEIPVSYAEGATVTMESKFKYQPAMMRSELWLMPEVYVGSSKYAMPAIKVADGVLSTVDLATATDATPALAPDKFQRIIKQAYDANVMFLIQQANVRQGELTKEDVEEWRYIVQNAYEALDQRVSVEVQAYASPDGKTDLNERLSEQRERNTTAKLKDAFRKQDLSAVEINAHYTAEDWEGFSKLVEASNLPDKDLVLRVLSMYPDPEQREREIRNLSSVFGQLADEILPQLRRSRLVANVEIIGKTDDEIKEWAKKWPGRLILEEQLYAATLFDTYEEQKRMYKISRQLYPKDYRAYNNLGVLEFRKGNMVQAKYWFDEANKVKSNPETNMNLALLEIQKGNIERADQLLSTAGNVPEIGQVMGLLDLKRGDYSNAVKAFGSTRNNNAAVAYIADGNYSAARTTLDAIAEPNAKTFYLKAVVGARMNNEAEVLENLGKAVSADRSYAVRAARDLEFAHYQSNQKFATLLK